MREGWGEGGVGVRDRKCARKELGRVEELTVTPQQVVDCIWHHPGDRGQKEPRRSDPPGVEN